MGFSPEMIGRQAELTRLRDLLAAARRSGQSRAVLVSGEAGIGKTRLLRELATGLDPGTPVLVGWARQGRTESPFGLLREAVATAVAGWDQLPDELARLERPLAQLLGPVARWATVRAAAAGSVEDLSWAGLELVSHLTGTGPALVVFEDLHWADAESAALFERLAVEGPPALVVGSVRPEDVEHRSALAVHLHGLRRSGHLQHMGLQRLTRDEQRELIESICRRPVDNATADLLYERTRGGPYFLEELIAGAAGLNPGIPADIDPEVLVEASLPWDTARAVLSRLGQLSPAALETARAAAVLGDEVAVDTLAAVIDTSSVDLLVALRELVDAGVLVEDAHDVMSFRHALTHEAVLGLVLTRERRHLHRRAFKALRADEATSPDTLAQHAAGAGDAPAAASWALAAAREALDTGAPRHAMRMARLGLEHHGVDLGLHAVAARAAERLGEIDDAIDHSRSWADMAAARTDHVQVAQARSLLAWLRWSAGDAAGAWGELVGAEQAGERGGEPRVIAAVSAVRAQLHLLAGDARLAFEVAGRTLEMAEAVDDEATVAHALATQGAAIVDFVADEEPTRLEEAREPLLRARKLAIEAGDHAALARAMNNLLMPGTGLLESGDVQGTLQQARQTADRFGLERLGAKVAALTVHAALVDGDRKAAELALTDRRLRQATPMESSWVASMEAHVAVEGGDIDRARAIVAACRQLAEAVSVPETIMYLATAEAELASAAADAAAAERALLQAGEVVPALARGAAADWWPLGVLALRAGVDPQRLDQLATRLGPPLVRRYLGAATHFRGALCTAVDRHGEAIEHLTLAVEAPQSGRPRSMLAAARIELAELLAAAGEHDEARRHASRAAAELEHWPGARQRIAAALRRRFGDGPPQPAELLTPREREVAQLLVRGYSNGEIATCLYISRKTASTHVTNILAKTQLQRRGQVAAWALQNGLVAHDLSPIETS